MTLDHLISVCAVKCVLDILVLFKTLISFFFRYMVHPRFTSFKVASQKIPIPRKTEVNHLFSPFFICKECFDNGSLKFLKEINTSQI